MDKDMPQKQCWGSSNNFSEVMEVVVEGQVEKLAVGRHMNYLMVYGGS